MPLPHLRDLLGPGHKQQDAQQPTAPKHTTSAVATEGVRVSRLLWDHFWDPRHKHFATKQPTAETIGDWNGYCVWPYTIGLEALLEAEAASPGEFTKELKAGLDALDKFYSPEHDSYCAWIYFPGNNDIYYDDNAQVAIAFLRAYELPTISNKHYLSRAKKIISFLFTGYDEKQGGMHWHMHKPIRNACSTSLSAVAALKLATIVQKETRAGAIAGLLTGDKSEEQLIHFAKKCLHWVLSELQLEDGLIKDGAGGGPTYTYNTGTTLHTLCLLQQLHPSDEWAQEAEKLANAAVDRTKSLYDRSVSNIELRYWWDNNFFMHLLVEGLVEYVKIFGQWHPETAERVVAELRRHVEYLQKYIKDTNDGMYWRNLRLYTISMGHLKVYKELTGDTDRQPELDGAERMGDEQSKKFPVGQRSMTKTILGVGGAARTFLLAGELL